MNKKEYAESFIEAIKNKEENLYRFFHILPAPASLIHHQNYNPFQIQNAVS